MLRTPLFSYQDYNLEKANYLLANEYFLDALMLGNPVLYQLLSAKKFDWSKFSPKEKLTIIRYYNRTCFRPTPFGAFSSFSVVQWNNGEKIELNEGQIHLQLDQNVSLQLASKLTASSTFNQNYRLNPTLYKIGREFRFIKTSQQNNDSKFTFSLESFSSTKLTTTIFGFCGTDRKTGHEIVIFIQKLSSCAFEEAENCLINFIATQILQSDENCNIVGEDYFQRLVNKLKKPYSNYHQKLSETHSALKSFKTGGPQKLIDLKDNINELLIEITGKSTNQIFYAGMNRTVAKGSLDVSYQAIIADGLDVLQLLVQNRSHTDLQQFIDNFKKRYDSQKISLLQALDSEINLDYSGLTAIEESTLIKNIKFQDLQDRSTSITWSATHKILFDHWCKNTRADDPLVINSDDLIKLSSNIEQPSLPSTLPVMFRILDDQIFIESAGGASANSLVGRFTPWSSEVLSLCRQVAQAEEAANPDVIFAEIGQISDNHIDNINRRLHIYRHEILINTSSTLPLENQIPLSDLFISVQNGKIVLESVALKKVIVPRLSSAYNFNHNDLSVFRLLCDLQYQGIRNNFTLDMETMFPGLSYYPRVVYNKTILCLAKWNVSNIDIQFLKEGETNLIIRFDKLRKKLCLPDLIAVIRHDQQLVFNLNKHDELELLLSSIKGMGKVVFQEFILPKQTVNTYEKKRPLISQFIAFVNVDKKVYPNYFTTRDLTVRSKLKRDYLLGSKWIYLRLYCHPSISNNLLVKKILPLLSSFNINIIKAWFFIRYVDTGHHIRLRLKIDESNIAIVVAKLKNRLAFEVTHQFIQEYQLDVYRRELERYGTDIIELVEDFFYASSLITIYYIKQSTLKSFQFTYHSLAFFTVNYLLRAFLLELDEQVIFLNHLTNSFYSEFSGKDKVFKIDLDLKYRELNYEIRVLLSDPFYITKIKLDDQYGFFETKTNVILLAIKSFSKERRHKLLADLIHMHLNRLFVQDSRKQELIIYYCLNKYTLSLQAIKNKN